MHRRTLKDICSDALDTPVSTPQGAEKSENPMQKTARTAVMLFKIQLFSLIIFFNYFH